MWIHHAKYLTFKNKDKIFSSLKMATLTNILFYYLLGQASRCRLFLLSLCSHLQALSSHTDPPLLSHLSIYLSPVLSHSRGSSELPLSLLSCSCNSLPLKVWFFRPGSLDATTCASLSPAGHTTTLTSPLKRRDCSSPRAVSPHSNHPASEAERRAAGGKSAQGPARHVPLSAQPCSALPWGKPTHCWHWAGCWPSHGGRP